MRTMELHCPVCHASSGNHLTVDWPEPLETRVYPALICMECGAEFTFSINRDGMRSLGRPPPPVLAQFLNRRRQSRQRT